MNNKEPAILESIFLDDVEKIEDVKIYPLTCARYLLLSKLESPFIDPTKTFDLENVLPSVFVFCNDIATLKKYHSDIDALKADALEAADEISMQAMSKIIDKILAKFAVLNKAAPNASSSDSEKKTPHILEVKGTMD